MDLLAIARKIWRYRIVTLPVIVLTLLGAAVRGRDQEPGVRGVLQLRPDQSASAARPQEEIATRPGAGRINTDNPFTRFTDQTVVVGVLASTLQQRVGARRVVGDGRRQRATRWRRAPSSATRACSCRSPAWARRREQAVRTAELVGAALAPRARHASGDQDVAQATGSRRNP